MNSKTPLCSILCYVFRYIQVVKQINNKNIKKSSEQNKASRTEKKRKTETLCLVWLATQANIEK